jgi:two-component system sensor histidine kinase KdpD
MSVAVSFLVERVFLVSEHVSTVFAFAVFLVSLLTDGYVYGMVETALGVLFINFAFTLPYFHFDFSARGSIFSAVIMLIISILTSALTTRLKKWQHLKARGEEEMMRANLLRAVSHDLRTPLTTIYGSSSAILDNYSTLSDEKKREMIRGIQEDSDWLIRIVENLLSVTRLDNGRAKILKSPTVLEELVDSAILKFKKRYPDRDVEVSVPDEIVIIPMDAILIEQVVTNMLENAVKHARGMKKLWLSVSADNGEAVFLIEDDGCGISKEKLPELFSGRVRAVDSDFDSEKKNSGIGLSVCATIIKAHGGRIFAENRKEGGARFGFALKQEQTEDKNGTEQI